MSTLEHEEAMLRLESRFVGNVSIIECIGRIVVGPAVEALEAALAKASHEFSRIVLNVREVDRLDSSGLGLLVRSAIRLRKRGGDIRLAEPTPSLQRLIGLTKLSAALPCSSTEEEAILSFLRHESAKPPRAAAGPRVLLVEQDSFLCTFIRTLLQENGFRVQSASLVRDAKILLQVDTFETILVGPGSPHLSSQSVTDTLAAIAPKAATLQLDDTFKSLEAHEAAQVLVKMFSIATPV